MSILGALSTSVSGLSAQSYALENISGNIANASTTGFKRVDTAFIDMIPDQPAKLELAGSVSSRSNLTTTLQGTLNTTGIATNAALSGDGFFVVAKNTGSNQAPVFSGQGLYTRRGDFTQDANGYLVNGSGYYLSGTTFNIATGSAVGAANSPIKVPNTPLAAKPTSTITYSGNLPSVPQPTGYSATTPNSELLPTPAASYNAAATPAFLNKSVTGGQITLYDSLGSSVTTQLRWAKTDSTTNTPPGTDTWNLYYQNDPSSTSTTAVWTRIPGNVTFDATGKMTAPASGSLAAANLSIGSTTINGVTMAFGSGVTQYGNASGTVSSNIDQNGYTSGSLTNLSIASDGSVVGNYSNGQVARVAQIGIAQFNASDALKRENGGAYSATRESGAPNYGLNGATLSGGAVEASNTDISDEFSKMIVTQQAYSANTKVITTAQQMLQDVINIIR